MRNTSVGNEPSTSPKSLPMRPMVSDARSGGTGSVTGNYAQGATGTLEVEIDGTEAGEFDRIAVGGNLTLGGTLKLKPSPAYASEAELGESAGFLTYGGSALVTALVASGLVLNVSQHG